MLSIITCVCLLPWITTPVLGLQEETEENREIDEFAREIVERQKDLGEILLGLDAHLSELKQEKAELESKGATDAITLLHAEIAFVEREIVRHRQLSDLVEKIRKALAAGDEDDVEKLERSHEELGMRFHLERSKDEIKLRISQLRREEQEVAEEGDTKTLRDLREARVNQMKLADRYEHLSALWAKLVAIGDSESESAAKSAMSFRLELDQTEISRDMESTRWHLRELRRAADELRAEGEQDHAAWLEGSMRLLEKIAHGQKELIKLRGKLQRAEVSEDETAIEQMRERFELAAHIIDATRQLVDMRAELAELRRGSGADEIDAYEKLLDAHREEIKKLETRQLRSKSREAEAKPSDA